MVALVLPTTTAPGQYQQESGGRIINAYVEPLAGNAGTKFALKRVSGLSSFGTTTETGGYRGGQLVGSTFYTAWAGDVFTFTSAGGAGTELTGSLLGTLPVIWARNNAATPNLVAVSPGDGAFEVTSAAISAYSDVDVGTPNSVCYVKSFFIFSYENGLMRASGVDSVSINLLDNATAESKPDLLYRVVPLGGQFLACGSKSIEVWGGQNDTGFPFSYIHTIDRGILGRYCIAGHEDGWGRERFIVGDDGGVYKLTGYQLTKVSDPDLDRLILAVTDLDTLQLSVYVANGRPILNMQCTSWTWEYDVSQGIWHERKSYQVAAWRGMLPHQAFNKWLVGDRSSGNILEIDADTDYEVTSPLIFEVETGPQGSFPKGARVNRLDLYMTVGTGEAAGTVPTATDPVVLIYMSKDNGLTWSNPWTRHIGAQGKGLTKVTVNNMGHCGPQGVKFKFRVSDPVHIGLMGGDVDVQLLGA